MATQAESPEPSSWTGEKNSTVDTFLLEAMRLEGQAALDVVAGEVGHEIAHTLNFLRCLVADREESALSALSSEDSSLAQKEVERLQRMLNHLRRLKLPPPLREPVQLQAVLRRAEAQIADLIIGKRVTALDFFGEKIEVLADPRLLYVLLRDSLAAVVRRAKPSSMVEVAPHCLRLSIPG